MPFHQEATFHDRQSVLSEVENSTSSTDYVDLPGGSLVTKSLSSNGSYIAAFSLLISGSLNNTTANFRILINDAPLNPDGVNITLKTKDLDIGFTLNSVLSDIPMGATLKIEYKTDKGTITVPEFNAAIDGVPQSRVVI